MFFVTKFEMNAFSKFQDIMRERFYVVFVPV
jgi:hypothetical protein